MEILEYGKYDTCPYKPLHTEEWLLKYFKKNFNTMTYNRFMWWRKYTSKTKPLPSTASFEQKVMNGDFDLSPFKFEAELVEHRLREKWHQYPDSAEFLEAARMDIARRKRLLEDHEKDENQKLDKFFKGMARSFKTDREEIEDYLDSFTGDTVKEFYFFLMKKLEDKPY
tara:strand:- start:1839 stop:2345 length:507 start_codon:yes stop_codon:yes gene_type:complete